MLQQQTEPFLPDNPYEVGHLQRKLSLEEERDESQLGPDESPLETGAMSGDQPWEYKAEPTPSERIIEEKQPALETFEIHGPPKHPIIDRQEEFRREERQKMDNRYKGGLSAEWEAFNKETEGIKEGDRYHPAWGGLFDDRPGAELSPLLAAFTPLSASSQSASSAYQQGVDGPQNTATGAVIDGIAWDETINSDDGVFSGDDPDSLREIAVRVGANEALVRIGYKADGLLHIGVGDLIGGHKFKTVEQMNAWIGGSGPEGKTFAEYSEEMLAEDGPLSGETVTEFTELLRGNRELTREQSLRLFKHDLQTRVDYIKGGTGSGMRLGEETWNSLAESPDLRAAILDAYYRGDWGPKTAEHIRAGNWDDASLEFLRSLEYKKKRQGDNSGITNAERADWNALTPEAQSNQTELNGNNSIVVSADGQLTLHRTPNAGGVVNRIEDVAEKFVNKANADNGFTVTEAVAAAEPVAEAETEPEPEPVEESDDEEPYQLPASTADRINVADKSSAPQDGETAGLLRTNKELVGFDPVNNGQRYNVKESQNLTMLKKHPFQYSQDGVNKTGLWVKDKTGNEYVIPWKRSDASGDNAWVLGKVIAQNLLVRSSPSSTAEDKGKIPKGKPVTIKGQTGDYLRVEWTEKGKRKKGWISSSQGHVKHNAHLIPTA